MRKVKHFVLGNYLRQLAKELEELSEKYKNGKLTVEDMDRMLKHSAQLKITISNQEL